MKLKEIFWSLVIITILAIIAYFIAPFGCRKNRDYLPTEPKQKCEIIYNEDGRAIDVDCHWGDGCVQGCLPDSIEVEDVN